MAKKDTVNYADIINRIALTREIEESKVVEALKDSVVTVLMRMERNSEKSIDEMEELIEVNFDIDKKLFEIYITREIVESEPKGLFEIDMVTAKALLKKKRLKVGNSIKTTFNINDFSRSDVKRIQQVFFNKIRTFEKMHIYKEFQENKLHTVVTGTVARIISRKRMVLVDLGKINGRLRFSDKLHRDIFKVGDKVKVFVEDITSNREGYDIALTRTSEEFVKYLLKLEVPEMSSNIVEIVNIVRIPGRRTKIAVYSKDLKIDPVGSTIGIHGTRINVVRNELRKENIDVIRWDKEPVAYIKNSLKPAEIVEVKITSSEKKALAVVKDDPDGQMKAKAIGEHGINIKLAERLTGWNIIIVTERELADIIKQQAEIVKMKIAELRSVPGIGMKKANQMVLYGFDSIDSIVEIEPEELTVIPGFGKKVASEIIKKAKKRFKQVVKDRKKIEASREKLQKTEEESDEPVKVTREDALADKVKKKTKKTTTKKILKKKTVTKRKTTKKVPKKRAGQKKAVKKKTTKKKSKT